MHHVIIVGSGFSGICMGIQLKEAGIDDFIILEKASSLGGTWRDNTYPGAECDIPSALYSYSFVTYPDWEYKWSHQPQILSYLDMVAEKYQIKSHIRYEYEVISTKWQADSQSWLTKTKDSNSLISQHLIIATGQLHQPSTPSWPDMDHFEGQVFHSARWDHSVDLKGKRVGVIGNAASAIQFIPEIAKQVKKLTIYQRSANWILPKQDRMYKSWEKKLVRKMPFLLRLYRLKIWTLGGALFFMMKGNRSIIRSIYQFLSVRYIKSNIKDPQTVKMLTPTYEMGAKRVLFSDTYYQTLAQDHVHLTDASIESWTHDGIKTAGRTEELDVVITATGFKTQPLLANIDITGAGGLHLRKYWEQGPKNYLGMTMAGVSNLFLMYGPNTNLGHNSIIIMSEAQAGYITQCITQLKAQGKKTIAVKSSVLEGYYTKIQDRLKSMIWASINQSWYKNQSGQITLNFPGRTMEYMRRTKTLRLKDYDLS